MLNEYIRIEKINNILSRLDESGLNALYMKVFNTDDGQLVLRDLANRCFVDVPIETDRDEGARDVWLSIHTRLYNGVNKKKQEEDDAV